MDYLSGWCKSKRRLDGSTAIVTGCNTGIGKQTVADFYARGARVIMACRDANKANAAKEEIEKITNTEQGKGELVVEKLDLCSLASVREFVERVLARETHIEILVNNAGVAMCPEGKTEDGFETHIASNHLAHALLTLLLLPRLRRSEAARIVFVSSLFHENCTVDLENLNFEKTPYQPYKAYCISKAANILFAKGLAFQLKTRNISNVTTYSLHPGVIGRTDIGRHIATTVGQTASWLFWVMTKYFFKSTRCGAQTTIYCAVDEACANQSGLYYADCAVTKESKPCRNEELAAKLWDWTINTLKLQEDVPFQAAA